jgi:predicted ArsR family transcriptional regulator
MYKISYDPNAYLGRKRNVRLGLVARSKILESVKKQASSVKDIGQASGLKYAVVLHHLKLLEEERVIQRKGEKRPYFWSLTGLGQKRLVER